MTAPPITTVKTVVDAIEHGGPGIKVFTLVDPDRWELPPFKPGAHIDLHLPGELVRTYSLCNDPGDGTRYVIAVKREAGGRGGSMALHDKIVTGDVIGVSLPRGGFDADENIRRYVFVAGGIGVTPYLSIAAYLSRIGHPDFTVHAVARDRMPLECLLAPLIEQERIVLHRTSKTGRPDIGALLGQAASGTAAGCCGPEGMILDFERATADWPGDRVHVERFVAPRLAVDLESNGLFVLARGNGLPRLIFPGFRDIRGYQAMYRDFLRSIRDGQAPEMSLERAIEDQRLMEQI